MFTPRARFEMIAILVLAATVAARAQSGAAAAVPGYDAARPVPGAHEMPDPKATYKVLFDVEQAAAKPGDVNPMLPLVARYVNTLAAQGVAADHRKIAVVFHQGGTDIVLNSDAFKSRNNGQDNPNIAIIQALKKAGVDFRVCGQAVTGRKIDPKTILPEIQLDLWALTTIITLESQGYVRIGG